MTITVDRKRVKIAQRSAETDAVANIKTREIRWSADTKRSVSKLEDGTVLYEGGYTHRYLERFGTLAAALTAFGTSSNIHATLANTLTLTADATIPLNVMLDLRHGGLINLNGFNLTINGPFQAGLHQVFSGSGTVTFGKNKSVIPQWWGAKGDGSTDDTTPFQYCLNTLALMSNGVMEIPYTNSYYSLGSLTIGKSGITIRGNGRLATTPTLKYRNTTGDFLTLDGGYSLFEGLSIHGNATTGHVVYLQNAFRTTVRDVQIINSDLAVGPFVGTGLRVGSSGANGECLLDHVLVQKCSKLLYINTNDGLMDNCKLIDATGYHIYAPSGGGGSLGGWEIRGLRAYNNTILGTFNPFTTMIYAQNGGYFKVFNSELELSGATGSGFYFKFGSQVGNLMSDCHLYSQTNNTTFFEFESISGDAVSYFNVADVTMHVATVTPSGNVGFKVSGAYGEATRVILDNVTADTSINTFLDTTALHFKVNVSDYTAGIVRKIAQYRTNPSENLFGVQSDVKFTDNASGFGYTLAALRGLATIQADAASALSTRATQGVVTVAGAFALTGSHRAGYFQIVDSRSAGAAADHVGIENILTKSGAGTVTTYIGHKAEASVDGAGNLTTVRLHHAECFFASSSGAVTTLENYSAETPTRAGGTHAITTAYGFRSKAQKQSWVTTAYGFRQEGASDLNIFDGDLQVPRIGVGKLPTQVVEVSKDASYNVDLRLQETSATGVIVRFWKSRGTEATPTIIVDADVVARIDTLGYHGSAFFGMGQIMCKADGTVTSGQRPPSRWEFYTSVANGAQTLAMTLDASQSIKANGRMQRKYCAATVTAANDITLLTDGDTVLLTGTTTINRITTTGFQSGAVITLKLPASGVVAHQGAVTSGALSRINLSGAANFTAGANGGTLTLQYNGTDWFALSAGISY